MFSTLQDVHHIQFFLAQLALLLIHQPALKPVAWIAITITVRHVIIGHGR